MSQPMIAYDAKEVMEAATRYFDGEEMVANVWMNKYALRDGEGHIYERTPDDMHMPSVFVLVGREHGEDKSEYQ